MCIRAQNISKDGISITFINGTEYARTRAEILTLYGQQTGNAAARKAATILAIKNQIVAAIGVEWLSVDRIDFDFDTANAEAVMVLGTRN